MKKSERLVALAAPRRSGVTPKICNDMHDSCGPQNDDVKQGDDFLAATVPGILASQAYQNGGLLIIMWDEATFGISCLSADCPIGSQVASIQV